VSYAPPTFAVNATPLPSAQDAETNPATLVQKKRRGASVIDVGPRHRYSVMTALIRKIHLSCANFARHPLATIVASSRNAKATAVRFYARIVLKSRILFGETTTTKSYVPSASSSVC
jgi:hypothetical protein